MRSTRIPGPGRPGRSGAWIAALAAAWLAGVGAAAVRAACPPTPDRSCRFSYRADFTYADSSTDTKDKLGFKFTKGASTGVGDFGDPTTTDGFDLCLYSEGLPVYEMAAGADGDCSDKSCWKTAGKGPVFTDKTGTPHGLTSVNPSWAINRNEFKGEVFGEAWTGTNNAGGGIAPNCGAWSTAAGDQHGWAGRPGMPVAWSAYGALPCNVAQRLICFEN